MLVAPSCRFENPEVRLILSHTNALNGIKILQELPSLLPFNASRRLQLQNWYLILQKKKIILQVFHTSMSSLCGAKSET